MRRGKKNANAQTAAAVSPRLYSHKKVSILYPWREKIINKRQLCATVGATHRRYFILWGCGPEPLLYFCSSGSLNLLLLSHTSIWERAQRKHLEMVQLIKFWHVFFAEKIILMYEWDNHGIHRKGRSLVRVDHSYLSFSNKTPKHFWPYSVC